MAYSKEQFIFQDKNIHSTAMVVGHRAGAYHVGK